MSVDNIIVGKPLSSLELLLGSPDLPGIKVWEEQETTVHFSMNELKNDEGKIFLPSLLKKVGIFESTSQIKQINKQRMKSEKFKNLPEQNLWRNLEKPEFTRFKIGKNIFWLIVGE